MSKFYITLAICAAAAMSATAANWQLKGELTPSLKIEKTQVDGSIRKASVLPALKAKTSAPELKADAIEIAGDYTITIGDYYWGEESKGEVTYPCTVSEVNGMAIFSCSYFITDIGGAYDAATGTVTFAPIPFGQQEIGTAKYYVRLEPFMWSNAQNKIIVTSYSVTYNAATSSITFPADHGFCWSCYSDAGYTSLVGQIEAFDVLGLEKTTIGEPVDPNEGWTNLGDATFMDGWLLPCFGIDQTQTANQYSVALQRNNDNSKVYRLVDPYKGKCPVAQYNTCTTTGYIQFDVTDPEHVVFLPVESGFANSQLGISKMYCMNSLTFFMGKYNMTAEQVIEALQGQDAAQYTTFKNGVVSLPVAEANGAYTCDACFGIQNEIYGGYGWQDNSGKGLSMITSITFPANFENGVEGVTADAVNGPVKYFNLQGQPVAAPARGTLVIRQAGDKVEKVIIR